MARAFIAVLLFVLVGVASADSWLPPVPITAVSRSAVYRLTVYPRQITGPLEYFTDEEDGKAPAGQRPGARAQCEATLEKLGAQSYDVVWRKPLVNDVAPLSALVTDDGRFVTFDNWHRAGFGPDAIVIYRADGTVVKKLGVADVVGEEAFQKLPRSVSSVWWGGEHTFGYHDGMTVDLQVVSSGRLHDNPTFHTIPVDLVTGKVLPAQTTE